MKLNTGVTLCSPEGEALLDKPGGAALTLGKLCRVALLTEWPDEKIDADKKARRYELACRLTHDGDVEVPAEDVTLLKALTGRFSVALTGAAWRGLEGKEQVAAKTSEEPTA